MNFLLCTILSVAILSAQISQSAFAFLFSELIQYSYAKANTSSEFHARLQSLGYRVGARAFELCCFRRDNTRREVKVLKMLVSFPLLHCPFTITSYKTKINLSPPLHTLFFFNFCIYLNSFYNHIALCFIKRLETSFWKRSRPHRKGR